jgi:hypothetical protein
MVDARLIERNARPRHQIVAARDSRLNRIDIDANNGEILASATGAATSEPTADSARQDDHEVMAPNLLRPRAVAISRPSIWTAI